MPASPEAVSGVPKNLEGSKPPKITLEIPPSGFKLESESGVPKAPDQELRLEIPTITVTPVEAGEECSFLPLKEKYLLAPRSLIEPDFEVVGTEENEKYSVVDVEGNPTLPVLEFMDVLKIEHDGTLDDIVEQTQKEFFPKNPDGSRKYERWELPKLPEEVEGLGNKLMPIFKDLGMIDEISPVEKEYESALVLGATEGPVRKRIEYLMELSKNGVTFDNVALLGGKRTLNAKEREKRGNITESEMMKAVWGELGNEMSDDLKNVEPIVVDAPMVEMPDGGSRRPNTVDTIRAWKDTEGEYSSSDKKNLVISSGPYTLTQDRQIRAGVDSVYIETVGPATNPELSLDRRIDAVVTRFYWEEQYLTEEKRRQTEKEVVDSSGVVFESGARTAGVS